MVMTGAMTVYMFGIRVSFLLDWLQIFLLQYTMHTLSAAVYQFELILKHYYVGPPSKGVIIFVIEAYSSNHTYYFK